MKKEDSIYIMHILERIKAIEDYLRGKSKLDFLKDKDLQDANIRRIEVIGEATKNISEPLRNMYRNVPWEKVAGTRDILIHAYFSVDLNLVWDILKRDLPSLHRTLENILKEIRRNNF